MGSIYSKWWNSLHALIAEQNDAIRHDLALSPFLFLFRLLGIYFWLDGRPILDDPLPIFFSHIFFCADQRENYKFNWFLFTGVEFTKKYIYKIYFLFEWIKLPLGRCPKYTFVWWQMHRVHVSFSFVFENPLKNSWSLSITVQCWTLFGQWNLENVLVTF